MRQAGIIAAAGIVALLHMTERLTEDHAHAKQLAEGFAALPGIKVGPVHSNIFYFHLTPESTMTGPTLTAALKKRGILLPNRGPNTFRVVTHYWISDADVSTTLGAMRDILS